MALTTGFTPLGGRQNPYHKGDVLGEYTTPGTYTLEIKGKGVYEIEAISGGGGGEHIDHYRHINTYHSYYSGSTGAYFKGTVTLNKGEHTIVIGSGGASYAYVNYPTITGAGGQTSIDEVFVLSGGAGCGYEVTGSGGALTTNTAVKTTETYNAGYASIYHGINKDWYTSFGIQLAPVPEALANYGYGGSSGGPGVAALNGASGYLKITYKGMR